ncbi:FlgK family flagellar hook-associated protein [Butyrivibrio sp. FCS014]|uniref:FlgK family flagellar hook-associated protein n=1 Tax=Butyrivibrio sp. FCS014 TaxID=1408304 RepID=UPI000463AC76|nr:hypothetical protein [Butyrivibrio sp. FCS014]
MVDNINKYGDRIQQLNHDIVDIESGKQEKANDLRDERNLLLDKLAEYGRIDYQEDTFGNVLVLFERIIICNFRSCQPYGNRYNFIGR